MKSTRVTIITALAFLVALSSAAASVAAGDCESLSSKAACNANKGCSWCLSGAVPSKCYDAADAKKLPPGVFVCDKLDGKGFLTVTEAPKEERLCDPAVKQASGYFRLQEQNKHYFYWFFESRNDPANDPVILWMTGGPGCSSEIALFGENGPCKVSDDGMTTTLNPYSWNSNASIIFIDQPAGTGFSFGSHDHDEAGVSQDMYEFLTEFFGKFDKFQKNKFFIFGESYAGHYVPATSHRVWLGNKRKESDVHINLAGVAVGNGLTDPEIQYKYYPEMAYNSGTTPSRIGFVEYTLMTKVAVPACIALIRKCNEGKIEAACIAAFTTCNMSLLSPVLAGGWNQYDLRVKCAKPPLCYDFSGVNKFLARPDVKKTLGVAPESEWTQCNRGVNMQFMGDWMHNYQNQIPDLLASGIPVLIYAGDADFVCNWLGNQAWTLALEWPGKEGFNKVEPKVWTSKITGTPAGKARSSGGLTFLQVFAAGHMVPLDQPEHALDMVKLFTLGGKTEEIENDNGGDVIVDERVEAAVE